MYFKFPVLTDTFKMTNFAISFDLPGKNDPHIKISPQTSIGNLESQGRYPFFFKFCYKLATH